MSCDMMTTHVAKTEINKKTKTKKPNSAWSKLCEVSGKDTWLK